MKKLIIFLLFLSAASCGVLKDIEEIGGTCTIVLTDGSSIIANGGIEISEITQAITYRDEDGKLWSLFKDDYQSYSCN